MSKKKKSLILQMFHLKLEKMEIDVTTITPNFCKLHCQYFDADYQPSDDDFAKFYENGFCIFTEYVIPCQLLDLDFKEND